MNMDKILDKFESWTDRIINVRNKMVRENSSECHNYKPQLFPDSERKSTKPNKRISNKSTKISSLFPKRVNRNFKRTVKYKNKITQGKT